MTRPDGSVERNLRVRCPHPPCRGVICIPVSATGESGGTCRRCGATARVNVDEALARTGEVGRCAACGGTEFFIRKDFPQRLGLILVVLFGAAASIFYYYENIPATFGTLASLVVVDAAIYFFVGRVTVCYRCRAEYRGVVYNPEHHGFDLATSEKYDPSTARLEQP